MAKNINEEFLTAYRLFEDALKNDTPSMTVYDYNSQPNLPDTDNRRLQLIRLIRNYLAHQPDTFVSPTKEMISYLEKLTAEINKKRKTAKDIMSRVTPLTPDIKIADAAAKLGASKPFLPVVDKDKTLIGLFTRETIRKAVANKSHSKTIKAAGGLDTTGNFVTPDTPAENILALSVVTSNGKIGGIYKGIIA